MKTTFFIDIDQTISTGHVCRNLAESITHYRGLGLDIPNVEAWPALFQLPEVLRRHERLPDSRVGVLSLMGYGDIYYATVRAPDVEQITCDWLHEQGFPLSDRVVLCRSIVHKLRELAQHPGRLVLIDDRWRVALEQWPRLVEIDPAAAAILRDRLTLVAFGSSQQICLNLLLSLLFRSKIGAWLLMSSRLYVRSSRKDNIHGFSCYS